MDGVLATILHLANETGISILDNQKGLQSLPWFWTRLLTYQRQIENVYERSAFDPEKMLPPVEDFKWLDDPKWVERWFEDRKAKQER